MTVIVTRVSSVAAVPDPSFAVAQGPAVRRLSILVGVWRPTRTPSLQFARS